MTRKIRQEFSPEFKREAVRLLERGDKEPAQLARQLGIRRNQTNYKLGLTYRASPNLTLRAGYTYGKRAHDNGLDSVTFGVVASNPIRAASMGFTWKTSAGNQLHMGYARITGETYGGPSALFPGATESVKPYVKAINVAWSRQL